MLTSAMTSRLKERPSKQRTGYIEVDRYSKCRLQFRLQIVIRDMQLAAWYCCAYIHQQRRTGFDRVLLHSALRNPVHPVKRAREEQGAARLALR